VHQGRLGTWEALWTPSRYRAAWELPHPKLLAPGRRRACAERRTQAHGMVPPREGNEARWDGRRASERPIVLLGVGEPGLRGPYRGKGAPRRGPDGGHQAEDSAPRSPVPATPPASVAGCEPAAGRAVCLNRARTDLRERRGVIPGATRPDFPIFLSGASKSPRALLRPLPSPRTAS